jgi:DNA mismatch repair protein MutS2
MQLLKNLDWLDIVEKISNFSTSESAKEEILKLSNCESEDAALKSFYKIECSSLILSSGIRPHMESVDLFDLWHARLKKKAVLKPLEIRDVRTFCMETVALKECLDQQSTDWSIETNSQLMKAIEPLSAIDQLLTPSGDIRMDASERLYSLSKEKDTLARQIQNQMDRLVKDHQMESMLQDKYVTTREGRWVIPVKGGLKQFVPGVVHGSSQTKQTVYVEPEVVIPLNNRLRQVEIDIEDEIERLLNELSNYFFSLIDDFLITKAILLQTDILLSKAQLALVIDAKTCSFSENSVFLKNLFHPVLKMSGKKPITNSIELNQKKSILLLSGPNAGGKTVLLKSIGLAAQMARCGLLICADPGSYLPFFNDVLTSIGDAQSVDEDLSTFAAHLKQLNSALGLKGYDKLILIDEICGSTDPEEGSALARAFIQRYSENQIFAIITSHLTPLKTGWNEDSSVVNGSLEFNTNQGKPTYRYLHGVSGDSLALLTAKRVGVDADVLKLAADHLSPLAKKRLHELESIEKVKIDLFKLQESYQTKIADFNSKNLDLEKRIHDFESKKETELQKTLQKATAKIETEISQIKASEALDRHRKMQNIKFNLPEIVKGQTQVKTNPAGISTAKEFTERFPPGTKIFVPSLNQDAIIQSTPNGKGEILILSNSLRLQVPWEELRPAQKSSNPTARLARQGGIHSASLNPEEKIVDLRGQNVEKALSKLENALDLAVTQQEERIKIVHGHGSSDILKKSIRNFLSRSVYVKKWKAGGIESGGDGITWVELGLD